MSLLPQHKKSADEIAKLRESLGIVAPPPVAGESPAEISVMGTAPGHEKAVPAPEILEIPAVAEIQQPKPVRTFKPGEGIPVLPVEENEPQLHSAHPPAPPAIPAPHGPKIVRSLRKSEQIPLAAIQPPAADSKLPFHRHSDEELHEIRRHDALATLAPWTHPQSLTAHLALVVPGYLFAIAGAVCFYFYDVEKQELRITAGCAAVALLVAAFIFFKKPLSRHHAAFIGVMAMFVIVFGALYYFPQLRHGT